MKYEAWLSESFSNREEASSLAIWSGIPVGQQWFTTSLVLLSNIPSIEVQNTQKMALADHVVPKPEIGLPNQTIYSILTYKKKWPDWQQERVKDVHKASLMKSISSLTPENLWPMALKVENGHLRRYWEPWGQALGSTEMPHVNDGKRATPAPSIRHPQSHVGKDLQFCPHYPSQDQQNQSRRKSSWISKDRFYGSQFMCQHWSVAMCSQRSTCSLTQESTLGSVCHLAHYSWDMLPQGAAHSDGALKFSAEGSFADDSLRFHPFSLTESGAAVTHTCNNIEPCMVQVLTVKTGSNPKPLRNKGRRLKWFSSKSQVTLKYNR